MIIVSFTTIPERLDIDLPKKSIMSLLAQDRKADLVILNIPSTSRKGIPYNKQKAMELQQPGVVINWMDQDYGPITKLFGTLDYIEKQNIQNARIVLVDDDSTYEPWMIRRLCDEGGQASGYVSRDIVTGLGRIDHSIWQNSGSGKTVFLETYAGVIYDAALFLPFESCKQWFLQLPIFCHNADDIVIAAWIQTQGVVPTRIPMITDSVHHDAANTTELRSTNLVENNINVVQYFFDNQYFPEWQTLSTYLLGYILRYYVIFIIILIGVVVYYVSTVYSVSLRKGYRKFILGSIVKNRIQK